MIRPLGRAPSAVHVPAGVRRSASAALCLALCLPLAGCTPSGRAVGDTQTERPAVAHVGVPRDDVTIALIGSKDATADSTVLDALADAGLRAVYVSARDSARPDDTRRGGVADMVRRAVDLIVVSDLDTSADGVDADGWDRALGTARDAGIPVALLDLRHAPDDDTLYAAAFILNDRDAEATPVDDAAMSVIDDEPHERTIAVTTIG
ncbi:sugar ABC transporter substrate-binding protein [Bifidobacterium sp. MA2]|uniref:Sugar ABC transporter substrate-binding protein n=1 Tax=Bifidobacterium santillanense TaxID=2809028 RepID=A0ABS5UML2_9BIFI|nr:sugar ABC transporter substrate-binding protein [Bifidobacterium santillanense]MBT1172155.1 sugar ABC transporter substrate-binding protein [Bifidobacterium santillanense]